MDQPTQDLISGVEDLSRAVNDLMKWLPRKCRILVVSDLETGMMRTLDPVAVNQRMKDADKSINEAIDKLSGK